MRVSGEENKNSILELLHKKGKVSTNELSKCLELSTESIRRYLEALEKEAKLKRIHGGAIKLSSYSSEESLDVRYLKNEKEKIKIAKEAVTLIKDGDKIIIDEGTTTIQMVDYLKGKRNLTIVTSSFPIANRIMNLFNRGKITGELIFLGGIVQADNKRTVGSSAVEYLDNYYVDKAFISCEGISVESGITAYDRLKAELTKAFIKHSKENIVLVDYSKVGLRNYYKIEELYKINRIITDKDAPKEWLGVIEACKINWIVAK